jgi:general secretion pathway protein I
MKPRGFTLLEMLVATAIMGIAVVALLANLSTSLNNAAHVTEYDRAAVLARRKMDELLVNSRLPKFAPLQGEFDPASTGGVTAGWRARLTPFEAPPEVTAGSAVLERLEFEAWWGSGEAKRTLKLEGFRRSVIKPEDVPQHP